MRQILDARRPLGRFFCCLISVLLAVLIADAAGPATTSVTDTVYRADGTPAAGTLVIAWNAFTTSEGKAIPAGRKTVKIGAAGAVDIPLVPNFGATPEGTYYKVTYKLDDGSTSEEYWSVPAAPATTIGAIRSKLVPANVAVQYATRQYVDSMLAGLGGGGTSGNAVKIQGKDVDTMEPARGQSLTFDGTKYKPVSHPEVDLVRDCGAVGDGVTDDGPAIQACLNNHPGRLIGPPKTRAASVGGGGATNCDFRSSQTLTLSGNGQTIKGDPDAFWSGGSCMKFDAGVNPLMLIPANCYACGIDHMELRGQDTMVGPANGVEIRGGFGFVRHSHVSSVGGNGVWINGAGASGYIADGWEVSDSNIGGFTRGLYAQGIDANTGRAIGNTISASTGCTAAIENNSSFVNWYIGNHLEGSPGTCPVVLDTSGNGYWSNYAEGGQGAEVYKGTNSQVVSGWHGSGIDWTNSQYPTVQGGGDTVPLNLGSQTYLEVYNRKDATQTVYTRAGRTADAGNKFPAFRKYDNNSGDYASLYLYPANPAGFGLFDEVNQKWRVRADIGAAGTAVGTYLDAVGGGQALLTFNSGTGGTCFGNGAGSCVGTVNSSGLGTFNGGVTTPLQLTSTVASGTSPLSVISTTPVANLTLASDSQLPTISSPGKIAAAAVTGIQGRTVASTAPADGDCYKWVASASEWRPSACAGGGGSANGSTNYVQVNNAGAFGSDSGFQWDLSNHRLGILANGAIDAPVKVGANAAAGFIGVGPLVAMAYNVNDTNFPSVRYPMGMVDANDVSVTNGGANNTIYGSWFSQLNAHGPGISKIEPFVSQGEVTGASTVPTWYDFSAAPTVASGSTISQRHAYHCDAHLGAGTVTTEICFSANGSGYGFVQDGTGKNYLRGKLAVNYQGDPSDALDIGGATGNLYFRGGKGQHIRTQSANNDLVGTVSVSSSTTASVSFTTSYTATPVCVLTPQTAGLNSWYLSAISNTGFTVTVAPSGSYTFGYICIGNPN